MKITNHISRNVVAYYPWGQAGQRRWPFDRIQVVDPSPAQESVQRLPTQSFRGFTRGESDISFSSSSSLTSSQRLIRHPKRPV